MSHMVVTNGSLLKLENMTEMTDAGLSSLTISVDEASQTVHEQNRSLPGVCERIRQAVATLRELGMHAMHGQLLPGCESDTARRISVLDSYQALRKDKVVEGIKALRQRTDVDSRKALSEEVPWILRF